MYCFFMWGFPSVLFYRKSYQGIEWKVHDLYVMNDDRKSLFEMFYSTSHVFTNVLNNHLTVKSLFEVNS